MEAKIDLYHSPRDYNDAEIKKSAAIVIDVLRASNSIITAIENGCKRVLPVVEIYEAKTLAVRLAFEQALLCGERDAKIIPGFNLGNSPDEYRAERVRNRTLIFCSTNGSGAMVRAGVAPKAVVGCFANVSAIVEKLKSENHLAILCAGLKQRLSLEDTVCGGAFVDALLRARPAAWRLNDAAAAAQALFLHHAKDLAAMAKSGEHGSYLSLIGAEEDVKFCTQVDSTTTVPVIRMGEGKLVAVFGEPQ
jgi:2-phosphosulfolactate phosphatase